MVQKVDIDGVETEVYTAAEVEAVRGETRTAVEGEFTPKLTAAETEKARLEGLLQVRAGEFKEVRKLSDEAVAKLTVAERTIYENGLAIAASNQRTEEANANAKKATIESTLRAKVGSDTKLFEEARKMYDLLGLEDLTPEQIAIRADAALGAVARVQPDLLAAAGFAGGSFEPPKQVQTTESFADTERGRQGASELGLKVEEPKK